MINATKKWIFLKVSTIILIPLMIWFVINFVSVYDQNYNQLISFFSDQIILITKNFPKIELKKSANKL